LFSASTLESDSVVVGGGAVDAALNVAIEKLAETLGSREQVAAAVFLFYVFLYFYNFNIFFFLFFIFLFLLL
jgi:hypothetical protein